jgi:hypothetical protein
MGTSYGRATAEEPKTSFKVIVNENNSARSISRQTLSNMLLKKVLRWDNGLEVRPVDLLEDSPVRQALSLDVHKRSVTAIQAYWQQQIFSGRDVPPPEKATEDDLITYVRVHAGAVGYVAASARAARVKVIALEE